MLASSGDATEPCPVPLSLTLTERLFAGKGKFQICSALRQSEPISDGPTTAFAAACRDCGKPQRPPCLAKLHRLRSEFVRGVAAERYRLAPTSITVPPWGEAARSASVSAGEAAAMAAWMGKLCALPSPGACSPAWRCELVHRG